MCLAVPARIVNIQDQSAIADMHGNRVTISTALLDQIAIGDWVLLHAGFAIQRLAPEQAHRTWSVLADLQPPGPQPDTAAEGDRP